MGILQEERVNGELQIDGLARLDRDREHQREPWIA
jgi:hypothetical protein